MRLSSVMDNILSRSWYALELEAKERGIGGGGEEKNFPSLEPGRVAAIYRSNHQKSPNPIIIPTISAQRPFLLLLVVLLLVVLLLVVLLLVVLLLLFQKGDGKLLTINYWEGRSIRVSSLAFCINANFVGR
jgi:hypothetical protein